MCHTRCLPLGNTAASSGILSIPAADTTASSRMRRKAIDHLHAMNAHIHTRQGREEFIFLLRIGVDMIPVTGRRSRGSQNTQKTLDGNHRIVFHETGEVLWGEARFGDEAKGASFPWHGTRILAGGVGSGGCGWRLFRVFVRSAPFGFAFVATATAVVVVSIVVVVVVGTSSGGSGRRSIFVSFACTATRSTGPGLVTTGITLILILVSGNIRPAQSIQNSPLLSRRQRHDKRLIFQNLDNLPIQCLLHQDFLRRRLFLVVFRCHSHVLILRRHERQSHNGRMRRSQPNELGLQHLPRFSRQGRARPPHPAVVGGTEEERILVSRSRNERRGKRTRGRKGGCHGRGQVEGTAEGRAVVGGGCHVVHVQVVVSFQRANDISQYREGEGVQGWVCIAVSTRCCSGSFYFFALVSVGISAETTSQRLAFLRPLGKHVGKRALQDGDEAVSLHRVFFLGIAADVDDVGIVGREHRWVGWRRLREGLSRLLRLFLRSLLVMGIRMVRIGILGIGILRILGRLSLSLVLWLALPFGRRWMLRLLWLLSRILATAVAVIGRFLQYFQPHQDSLHEECIVRIVGGTFSGAESIVDVVASGLLSSGETVAPALVVPVGNDRIRETETPQPQKAPQTLLPSQDAMPPPRKLGAASPSSQNPLQQPPGGIFPSERGENGSLNRFGSETAVPPSIGARTGI
mmetsp:Transcript_31310/g.62669  ORF Transcript_31310/g.62669 Transcript_31310/m.62669 type:complete len:689 (+) Transcript_31310:898-2964(+)